MFKPKFFTMLKGITKEQVISDITAGTIVGIVALPLAIADLRAESLYAAVKQEINQVKQEERR